MGKLKVIAVGGGEIKDAETKSIDREIIRLTGKSHPKLLFIPTASGDSEGYYKDVKDYFEKLGCKTDVLYLIKEKPSKKTIEEKVSASDFVYVGGGNTLRMLKLWRKYDLDSILEKAAKKGVVLSGLSAGAMCWFKYGNSDSMKFGPSKSKKLIRLEGLGLINLMVCPHYNVEKTRRPSLIRMIKQKGGVALALDNCSAIEIIGQDYRIITSSKKAHAYRLYKKKGKVIEERLPLDRKFRPLEGLYKHMHSSY